MSYRLRRSKRIKRIQLSVRCDGIVSITAPHRVPVSVIESVLKSHSDWLEDKIKFFKKLGIKKFPIQKSSRKDYLAHKEKARALVHERILFYNKIYGFSYNNIAIRNQKTRWGSCSSKGNLNFNYKIIFLAKEQQDYIIVHELCHLQEFNHSRRFWSLVARTFPDYRTIRQSLRRRGLSLQ